MSDSLSPANLRAEIARLCVKKYQVAALADMAGNVLMRILSERTVADRATRQRILDAIRAAPAFAEERAAARRLAEERAAGNGGGDQ